MFIVLRDINILTIVNYKKNNKNKTKNPQSIYTNYNIQHQFVGCLKVVGAYMRTMSTQPVSTQLPRKMQRSLNRNEDKRTEHL